MSAESGLSWTGKPKWVTVNLLLRCQVTMFGRENMNYLLVPLLICWLIFFIGTFPFFGPQCGTWTWNLPQPHPKPLCCCIVPAGTLAWPLLYYWVRLLFKAGPGWTCVKPWMQACCTLGLSKERNKVEQMWSLSISSLSSVATKQVGFFFIVISIPYTYNMK